MKKSLKQLNTIANEELTLKTLVGDALNQNNSHSFNEENENQLKVERIQGTPFDLRTEDGRVAVMVGKWTCSEVLENTTENVEKLIELVRRRDWNLITTLVGALIEVRTEYNNLTKTEKNEQ